MTQTNTAPQLLVTIDTEEEFDWSADFSRTARSVKNIAHQHRAQSLFEARDLVPTYVIDQAVLEDVAAVEYFKDLAARGVAEVGVHLHPWLTKPYSEALSARNSFHGNLPVELEQAKINTITETFNRCMGYAPTLFKAGRYGLGPNSYDLLAAAGYLVDLSPVPNGTYCPVEGPDFTDFHDQPFWPTLDDKQKPGPLLSVPLTRAVVGAAAGLFGAGRLLSAGLFDQRWMKTSKMIAVLSRLRLAERITLTPEGVTETELKRLLKALMAQQKGQLLSMAYHSSSLMVGGSPYSGDEAAIQRLLARIEAVMDSVVDAGGSFTTASAVYQTAAEKGGI